MQLSYKLIHLELINMSLKKAAKNESFSYTVIRCCDCIYLGRFYIPTKIYVDIKLVKFGTPVPISFQTCEVFFILHQLEIQLLLTELAFFELRVR